MLHLNGSTILVTGATGFTGSFVAARLAREGVQVRALVRRADARVPDASVVVGDLTDPASLGPALEEVDAVVHCAIAYQVPLAYATTLTVDGTRALAEGALAAGCQRFVHMSTISALDERDLDIVDEDTPLYRTDVTEAGPYSVTKAGAERALAAVAERGLSTVVLRPPAILGPHLRCSWTLGMATRIARGAVGYSGDDSERLPYVYVENLADAVVLALRSDTASGSAFNIVDGQVPWSSYLRRLADAVHSPLPSGPSVPDYALEQMRRRYPATKAREDLGYRPRVDFDEAMARIEAFVAQRVTPADVLPD